MLSFLNNPKSQNEEGRFNSEDLTGAVLSTGIHFIDAYEKSEQGKYKANHGFPALSTTAIKKGTPIDLFDSESIATGFGLIFNSSKDGLDILDVSPKDSNSRVLACVDEKCGLVLTGHFDFEEKKKLCYCRK